MGEVVFEAVVIKIQAGMCGISVVLLVAWRIMRDEIAYSIGTFDQF